MTALGGPSADEGGWPLLRSERTWSSWRLGVALVTVAAATWCYLIGEYAGYYLKFTQASFALTAGSMIGMTVALLAAGPACVRFGIESVAGAKPQFGTTGWAIPALMQQVILIGWNMLLLIFFAKSLRQLLDFLGWIEGPQQIPIVPLATTAACGIIFLALQWGAGGYTRIANVLVLHVLVGSWMLFLLVSRRWPELSTAQPPLAHPDRLWNYTTVTEMGIMASLSWWAYMGALIRMAPNGRTIAVPVMLGMGAPVPLLSMIGIAGILVLKTSDPSSWLRSVGGPVYGLIALSFVVAANFGTAIAGVYASAVGLRNFRALEKVPWWILLLMTIMPIALVGGLMPNWVFEHFGTLLAAAGVAFAPLCGIQIVDYYVLRRRKLDVRAIYTRSPDGAYHYWNGINPAAIIAQAIGCATYIYLLNPVTYESHGPYRFVTASLPAALAAAVIYAAVTKLVVIPAGWGGYRR